jgi:hypothetical protein
MKKSLIIAAAALISASAFAATSANVVGYVKKETPAGSLSMQGVPFLGTNTTTVSELFGDTMPLDTKIYIYDDNTYSAIETYSVVGSGIPPNITYTTNWTPDTASISGTTGFWVSLPEGSSATTNLLSGDVVDESVSITIKPGLNLIAIPYSSEITWTNTALAQNATLDDKVYTWNNDGQTYEVINQYTVVGSGIPPNITYTTNWSDTTMTLDLGEGFWYNSNDTVTNVIAETQPYTL